ncbi:3507_t:CDS:1, partial [Funneliformis caledonium]
MNRKVLNVEIKSITIIEAQLFLQNEQLVQQQILRPKIGVK